MQQEITKDALILKETINGNEIIWTIKPTFGGLKINWYNKTEDRKSEEYYKWYWSFNEDRNGEKNIDFYDRAYKKLPEVIRKICNVKNETDSMTDYFENDRFEIRADHPLFKLAAEAIIEKLDRRIKQTARKTKFSEEYKQTQINRYKKEQEDIKFYLLTNSLWE